jgi:hypothetical protein
LQNQRMRKTPAVQQAAAFLSASRCKERSRTTGRHRLIHRLYLFKPFHIHDKDRARAICTSTGTRCTCPLRRKRKTVP